MRIVSITEPSLIKRILHHIRIRDRAKDVLRPTASAFVDIIRGLNGLPRESIGASPFIQRRLSP